MSQVVYFEIPVDDLERAIRFYGEVFGVTLERESIDGNEMALFPVGDGAAGALAKGDSYHPSRAGVRVYFGVADVAAVLARAVAAGGAVLYPVTSIGERGRVAEFQDSEGNCIALHDPGAAVRTD
jgi:predicted enzyme related to lactoylglutathione lyase